MKETDPSPLLQLNESKDPFPVVGVGASAGGLDAFKRFLGALPVHSNMAFVLVQHLDPNHDSLLPEILAKYTDIPVVEITDDIKIERDHIYVIPSNSTLISTDGVLKLTQRTKIKSDQIIDSFFKSLGEVHQGYACGIILSGNGNDGTMGLKALKANGGITFAQDEESAANKSMPATAIDASVVDFVLTPEGIAEKLMQINFSNKLYKANTDKQLTAEEEDLVRQILSIVYITKGVDFTHYKQNTILRRLERRMAISKKDTLKAYLLFLKGNHEEESLLYYDLLIPVSSFFRDPEVFQVLTDNVFPELVKFKTGTEPFRIWSVGCSTGEEAYSLAICLHEFFVAESITRQIQVFGSDVSEIAIKKAREGNYTIAEAGNISPFRLNNYFIQTSTGYQARRVIRDMCVFAIHNLLKDPPFAKMDIVSCRNVLIYFDNSLQKKALSAFHYSLKEKGFLVLGKSETTSISTDLFNDFSKKDKIYKRQAGASSFALSKSSFRDNVKPSFNNTNNNGVSIIPDFQKKAESILLSKYTRPSVVVNHSFDIVYIIGSIAEFVEHAEGKPTFNLIKMTRSNLAFELRSALQKAKTNNAPSVKDGIPYPNDGNYTIRIEILPLGLQEPFFLIIFQKVAVATNLVGDIAIHSESTKLKEAASKINELQIELTEVRESMLAITHDQEGSNEELQTTNEELLSGNEELQSLNEEFETTKEEIQSTNEELIVVNQALIEKQEQLNQSRAYAEAIIQTFREPFVILDKELRIKTAGAAFYKKFNLNRKGTEGMLFYEISDHVWDNDNLLSVLNNVIIKKARLDDYEIKLNFADIGECVMLLNARQVISEINDELLILLAIEDITQKKIIETREKEFSTELELKVKERTTDLEIANLQLEQFAHTASHEFQEPLRKIVSFSTYVAKQFSADLPQEVGTYLKKIEVASRRMSKLVSDMLNFSMLEQHKKLFEKTDLNKILNDILFDFELLISEKAANITYDKLPVIEAIPFQMNQLFYDLLNNALKFSKPGSPPVIHISVLKMNNTDTAKRTELDPKLSYYKITIQDNGIGFNQKYAQQIFIMFQRLHESTSYAGTGIGLALCKKIVQSYHGEIYAEGEENKGAKFHVILPASQPKNEG
ncbi:MAG: CheR family methyltransferase [Ferruginibacter sp.]